MVHVHSDVRNWVYSDHLVILFFGVAQNINTFLTLKEFLTL